MSADYSFNLWHRSPCCVLACMLIDIEFFSTSMNNLFMTFGDSYCFFCYELISLQDVVSSLFTIFIVKRRAWTLPFLTGFKFLWNQLVRRDLEPWRVHITEGHKGSLWVSFTYICLYYSLTSKLQIMDYGKVVNRT